MSRLEKTFKNILLSFGSSVATSLLSMISRTFFVLYLGEEYLGLSGLLNNILGVLSIADIGFSSAIGYSLFKPLAERDNDTIGSLMTLYRRVYYCVGLIVTVTGLGLYLTLDFFIPPSQQPPGTAFAYFAFLLSTAGGYFLSYRCTLMASDNQAYKLVPISTGCCLLQTSLQIVVLCLFRSYVHYIFIQVICSVLSMFLQNCYVKNQYKDIDFNSKLPLKQEVKTTLKKNVGGLVISKIGDYLVNSTDNLIITKLISLATTGIYSNYLMIRNIVNGFIAIIFSNVTASMGNIFAVESDEKKIESFNALMFLAFFVYSFEAVCLFCLLNVFIGDIWIGHQFTFDTITVFVIVLNNYLTGLRIPLITMKSAAGIYLEDAWIPFGFAIINLASSVILAGYLGVVGVFLGTIIGSLCTADWYRPIIIYKKAFHQSPIMYFKKYILYIALGLGYMLSAYALCALVTIPIKLLEFISRMAIAAILPVVTNCMIFRKSTEFRFLVQVSKRFANLFLRRISSYKERI